MAGFKVQCSCGKKMIQSSIEADGKWLLKEEHDCPRCQAKVIVVHDVKNPTIILKAPMRVRIP